MGGITPDFAAIFRAHYGRVLAALIAWLRDFDLAEEALATALLRAVETWPKRGAPDNPPAWLLAVARRVALDRLRHTKLRAAPLARATLAMLAEEAMDMPNADTTIPDERLRLIFTCCHPALAPEAQIALTLKTLCGLSVGEIARAFLVQETTMAARITRAKAKIAAAGIPFSLPEGADIAARRDQVLAVVYLIYTAAHTAYEGDAPTRTDLAHEALHLAELLFALRPEPEVEGLLALLYLHESRRAARSTASGELVSLRDQDRGLWDAGLIARGRAHLTHALGQRHPGAYQIQAAISALHAEAASFTATDWAQIAGLYRALEGLAPSPIVTLNRAAAIAFGGDAQAALEMLAPLRDSLASYQPFYATSADICAELGDVAAAVQNYRRAIDLSTNRAEQAWLAAQLARLP